MEETNKHEIIGEPPCKVTVQTSCGITSRIPCYRTIPGTYAWYMLFVYKAIHPKKEEKKYEEGQNKTESKVKEINRIPIDYVATLLPDALATPTLILVEELAESSV